MSAVAAGHQRQQPDRRMRGDVQRSRNPRRINTDAAQCFRRDRVDHRRSRQHLACWAWRWKRWPRPVRAAAPLGSHAAQIYAKFAADHADLDFSAVIETLRGS